MIKFVLPLSRFLVSNQLKALIQLKANKNTIPPLELKQQFLDLVKEIPKEENKQFIALCKEFDYDYREIAAFYNQEIDAKQLVIEYHIKREPKIIVDQAYEFLLNFQASHTFQAQFGYESVEQYLTLDGMNNVLKFTERMKLKWAYLVIIQDTYYGQYLQSLKGAEQVQQVNTLKKMKKNLLEETDYNNIIWKTFLFNQIQPLTSQMLKQLYESICNVENLTNKQLLLIAQICFRTKMKLGNQKELSNLTKKFSYLINKIKNELSIKELIYYLLICKKHFDIYNKQELLCKPLFEQIRDVDNTLYPEVFQTLCNLYWYGINLLKEEQFIVENIEQFNNQQNLLDLLLGLIYAETQNIDLLQQLFTNLCSQMEKAGISAQCKFYQIYFLLEQQYKFKLDVENIQKYKETYINAPSLINTPVFSQAFIELSEVLHKIAEQTNKEKNQTWKITKITQNIEFEIFEIDFLVEIESNKKKEQFYFDFIQKSAIIDNEKRTAKQRIRENLLKNEQIIFIKYDDWFKIEDKELWIRKMMGKK